MTRKLTQTEIGTELQCAKCREFWPNDEEFFYFSKGRAHSWCKDCYVNDPKMLAKKQRWLDKAKKQRSEGAAA